MSLRLLSGVRNVRESISADFSKEALRSFDQGVDAVGQHSEAWDDMAKATGDETIVAIREETEVHLAQASAEQRSNPAFVLGAYVTVANRQLLAAGRIEGF
jgi:hypothetical protein